LLRNSTSARRILNPSRSAAIQIVLLLLAAAVTGLVFLNYPDPSAALRPPVQHRLIINAKLLSGGGTSNITEFVAEGFEVNLDEVMGGRYSRAITVKTNSSGMAEVLVNSGYYRISFADWWNGFALINKPIQMNLTRYDINASPSNVELYSLSKSWTLSQGDLIEVSYSNPLTSPIRLHEVTIGSTIIAKPGKDIIPGLKWNASYTVPAGVTKTWPEVRAATDILLRMSYTEVKIK